MEPSVHVNKMNVRVSFTSVASSQSHLDQLKIVIVRKDMKRCNAVTVFRFDVRALFDQHCNSFSVTTLRALQELSVKLTPVVCNSCASYITGFSFRLVATR